MIAVVIQGWIPFVVLPAVAAGYFGLGWIVRDREVRRLRLKVVELEHDGARAAGREPRHISEVLGEAPPKPVLAGPVTHIEGDVRRRCPKCGGSLRREGFLGLRLGACLSGCGAPVAPPPAPAPTPSVPLGMLVGAGVKAALSMRRRYEAEAILRGMPLGWERLDAIVLAEMKAVVPGVEYPTKEVEDRLLAAQSQTAEAPIS